MADKKKTLKEKIKSAYKKFEEVAASGALGTGGAGIKKKEKVAVDPNETVGGKRIKKQGPQPGPEDQEKHWENYPQRKLAGGGKATHGYGKAYMKGGRVK